MGNYIFTYGPKGRGILVDDDGRLLATGEDGATGYIFCYGDTGRALCVDASGRLLVNITGVSSNVTATNIGAGSGLYVNKVGSVLRFKGIIAGSGIFIEGTPSGLTIHNTYEDDVQDLRIDFDNASGVWSADISSVEGVANGVRTDFDNASGVWDSGISGAQGDVDNLRTDFTNSSGIFQGSVDVANGVRVDFDNASGIFQGGVDTANQVRIDFDNASGVFVTDGASQGVGEAIYMSKSATTLQFRGLLAGSGIVLASGFNDITIHALGVPSYKTNILVDAWTHDGSGLYYNDIIHSLGTRDIRTSIYDEATDEDVLVNTIKRLDNNTVRIMVNASGLYLRVLISAV